MCQQLLGGSPFYSAALWAEPVRGCSCSPALWVVTDLRCEGCGLRRAGGRVLWAVWSDLFIEACPWGRVPWGCPRKPPTHAMRCAVRAVHEKRANPDTRPVQCRGQHRTLACPAPQSEHRAWGRPQSRIFLRRQCPGRRCPHRRPHATSAGGLGGGGAWDNGRDQMRPMRQNTPSSLLRWSSGRYITDGTSRQVPQVTAEALDVSGPGPPTR